MNDGDIERIYKGCIDQSHTAALRAVFDAGYIEGAGQSFAASSGDDAGSAATVTPAQIQILDNTVSNDVMA